MTAPTSYRHRTRGHTLHPEYAAIARYLLGRPQFLVWIVGEFHRGAPVRAHHLTDQRDRPQFAIDAGRRAPAAIVGEIGAPADRHIDRAAQRAARRLDRLDVHRVGEHHQFVAGIAPAALPPG